MQGPLLASPPRMSPSVAVSETQAPAGKRLKTLLNDFEDDDQASAVPVEELVTYMGLRIPPETQNSKMNLLHWQVNEQVVPKLSLVAKRLLYDPASSSLLYSETLIGTGSINPSIRIF